MSSALKVLYLTPPARIAAGLAAESFVAEEILAIRNCGVVPVVLTDEIAGRTRRDGIEVVGVPRGGTAGLGAAAFMAFRHPRLTARVQQAGSSLRHLVHALRLEDAAAALVRREKIDVIHSHFGWPAGFGGSLAAAATGTPLVTSVRGTDILVRPQIGYGLRLDPAYDVAVRHLLQNATAILTATCFMRAKTIALGAPPERVRVLAKGVDTVAFTPPANRDGLKARLELSGPVVVAVGAVKKRKGFDVLIDAFSRIETPATLVICGDGEERGRLQDQAAGVAARVVFTGTVGRAVMPDYFAAADVFVHAAELEAAGNVVLEALASACAVVVTDCGGPSEYVQDGINGFVVPVGDAAGLAQRIETLLTRPALRERLATEGRRRVEERHRYPRMLSDLRALYDEVRQPVHPSVMHARSEAVS